MSRQGIFSNYRKMRALQQQVEEGRNAMEEWVQNHYPDIVGLSSDATEPEETWQPPSTGTREHLSQPETEHEEEGEESSTASSTDDPSHGESTETPQSTVDTVPERSNPPPTPPSDDVPSVGDSTDQKTLGSSSKSSPSEQNDDADEA